MTLIIQFATLSSMLYIVATPIGNLKDITLRALETLKKVEGIICEDSRRTSLLLNHYHIKKTLIVMNDYNEERKVSSAIEKLRAGEDLALVSDAGTPLISDPGFKLVRQCLNQNIDVDSIPGPSAVITALTLSGLPPDKFLFLGFLPEKTSNQQKVFNQIREVKKIISTTIILFVAPFKLLKTLEEMKSAFGDIDITLTRELTKIHQSTEKRPISNWLDTFGKIPPKGELTLLF